jgi:chromosome partitioning protein
MHLADCTIQVYSGSAGKTGRLDLLPSTLSLVEAENSPRQTEARLKLYLKEKAARYDCVIIDCPPTISFFTQAAILASDKYVVPIKPDPLSAVGLPLLERYIEDCTTDAGMNLEQVGLVFTMVRSPAPQAMRNVMDELRRERKGAVFTPVLNQATAVAESVDFHQPIINLRKSTAKIKMQVVDITAEFLKRTGV